MLSRNVEFKSFNTTVRISATHRRGEEPAIESQPWLELRGLALEPMKDVTDVVVSLYPKDKVKLEGASGLSWRGHPGEAASALRDHLPAGGLLFASKRRACRGAAAPCVATAGSAPAGRAPVANRQRAR